VVQVSYATMRNERKTGTPCISSSHVSPIVCDHTMACLFKIAQGTKARRTVPLSGAAFVSESTFRIEMILWASAAACLVRQLSGQKRCAG
jgi:hypothetical protein